MSSWVIADAISDCRKILSDGPTDKLRYRKKVIGLADGSNLVFKTFEMRRISTLAGATGSPVGLFLNNALKAVTSEDLTSGEFTITAPAPADGDSVAASYYVQWFTDDELTQFLVSAAQWITGADDSTAIANNLRPAAKAYVAAEAYQKLSLRFSENLAEVYQLQDAPDGKRFDPIAVYNKMAADKLKMAFELRDDVYKDRQGQAKAPRFATISGRTRDVFPKR